MKRIGWLISKYLVGAILPYFAFSWLLLSVILFIQQASKFSDIFFSVNIPANLIWQLTIALVPSVIAFTCPMAMLVGTIIGLSKMQGDSELVSVRVAGVSNFQIAIPIMVVGVLLSAFAFVVNLKGVPLAAALVRSVALQTAIKKLESPIEPGVFNTEIAGATIYVKSGDLTTGKWQNIFIFSEDANRPSVRLITSGNGRIDVTDQKTELVLENATVTTMPQLPDQGKYVTESIGEVRLAVKTSRSDLINRLTGGSTAPEELGLSQLSEFANASEGKERIEAEIIWQRRITLSITPFIFCLLGTMMILSFGRGGRGFGIVLAFIGLVTYYLLTFAGEQLARTGSISVPVAGLIPVIASAIAIVWLSYSRHSALNSAIFDQLKAALQKLQAATIGVQGPNRLVDLTTGIRDLDLIVNLVKYFV
ncbi:MAG: LptF/LptG family permease, partial [Pyrinomonadaceae bacterium]|nr:LptF/LptG family permease [Pyrinomonadaceae bacterium]